MKKSPSGSEWGLDMARGFEDDEILGKAYDGRLMRRLLQYVRPYRWRMVLALVLLFAAALAELAGPYLIREAIDGPLREGDVAGVLPIFWLYLLSLVAGFILRYSQIWVMQTVGQQVMVDLRLRIFSHIQRMSLSFFDRNPVGRLITRITNDVDSLNEFLTQGLVGLLGDFVTLIGIVIIMFALNWRLALLSIIVLPVVGLTTAAFQRAMRQTYRLVRQRLARINAFLNEQITGVLIVQLFNREKVSEARFAEFNHEYRSANLQSLLTFALFFPTVGLLLAVGT
ncbi:MAG TPA: ABC transporter ATP-binding protein, partial [Herpetosiphonaceae bacterium]|nr:ABC transporter ATP-binding protein [Herpetosiphonaceae bacterium]